MIVARAGNVIIDVLALFHFSPPVFSAALAVAEAVSANGRDLIAALEPVGEKTCSTHNRKKKSSQFIGKSELLRQICYSHDWSLTIKGSQVGAAL